MIAERPYIIYKLPNSRISQALKGRKLNTIWLSFKHFLESYTTANPLEPDNVYINGFSADIGLNENPDIAKSLLEKTIAKFGDGETNPIGYHYPENIPHLQTQTHWQLEPNQIEEALEYIISLEPIPRFNLGPVELVISYSFKLTESDRNNILPNQQFISSALISLSRSKWIAPIICFPFENPDSEFWKYYNNMSNHSPFKLDKKYLRRGQANKRRTANKFTKLEEY